VFTALNACHTSFLDLLTNIDLQWQNLKQEAANMMKKIELLEVSKRLKA
jgi:hypothetical protein